MALTSYSDLVTAITSWTHRSDLSTIAPDFITLAEQRIYNGSNDPEFPCKPLRASFMQTSSSGSASNGVIAFPSLYLETIRLYIVANGKNKELKYKSANDLTPYETDSANANYYTQVGGGLKVGPLTAAYTHDYYASSPALTVSNTTNTLMTNYPNLYLYACLIEAWMYVGNLAKAQIAYRQYMGAVNAIQARENSESYGSAGLAVSPS